MCTEGWVRFTVIGAAKEMVGLGFDRNISELKYLPPTVTRRIYPSAVEAGLSKEK